MSEMNLKIVAEGLSDIHLLRKILAHEPNGGTRFFGGQGKMSLVSLARNVIVSEGGPVLLVMDADTRNPNLIRENQSMVVSALAGPASQGTFLPTPGVFKVFVFVPEIEIVLFEAPKALEAALGKEIDEEDMEAGKNAPKETLAKLMGESKVLAVNSISRKLNEEAIDILREGEQAKAFLECDRSLTQEALQV